MRDGVGWRPAGQRFRLSQALSQHFPDREIRLRCGQVPRRPTIWLEKFSAGSWWAVGRGVMVMQNVITKRPRARCDDYRDASATLSHPTLLRSPITTSPLRPAEGRCDGDQSSWRNFKRSDAHQPQSVSFRLPRTEKTGRSRVPAHPRTPQRHPATDRVK